MARSISGVSVIYQKVVRMEVMVAQVGLLS